MSSEQPVSKRYLSDLKYGAEKEKVAEKYLKTIYKDLKHTTFKYARYDFYSKKSKMIIEIKGKKCKFHERTYYMLQKDKLDYFIDNRYNFRIFFVFNDNSIYELKDYKPNFTKEYQRMRTNKYDKKKLFHYFHRSKFVQVDKGFDIDRSQGEFKTEKIIKYSPIITDEDRTDMLSMMK